MRIPVFLSYPYPYNGEQELFIGRVKEYLNSRGIEPCTLGVTDYDIEEPLNAIRGIMRDVDGLITVGFRRYYIENGLEKPKNRFEKKIANQFLTSPWCHIETAMAFQLGLPILVFREHGVIEDGIFEKGVVGTYLPQFDLSTPFEDYFESEEWNQILGTWEGYVRSVKKSKGKPPKQF